MGEHEVRSAGELEAILEVDKWAREAALHHISGSITAAAIVN